MGRHRLVFNSTYAMENSSMNITKIILGASLWALPLSLFSSLGTAAWATTIELRVRPLLSGQSGACPQTFIVAYETDYPHEMYQTKQGMIQLSAIATNISVTQRDNFSATWTGTLKPEYRNCRASAGIVKIEGEDFAGSSYLRLQLLDGKVKAILDMTGITDHNGDVTPIIIDQTMRSGNPRWTRGGENYLRGNPS